MDEDFVSSRAQRFIRSTVESWSLRIRLTTNPSEKLTTRNRIAQQHIKRNPFPN